MNIDIVKNNPEFNELDQYYTLRDYNVDELMRKINETYNENTNLHPCLIKSLIHKITVDNCDVHVFRHFPFFIELEAGRPRYSWGCSSPAGNFMVGQKSELWLKPYTDAIRKYLDSGHFQGWSPVGFDHHCPGYDTLLKVGISGIIKSAELRLDDETDADKIGFLQAAIESNNVLIELLDKFSVKACEMMTTETDEIVKLNLKSIADAAHNLKTKPPETFYEALSLIFFIRENYGTLEGFGMSTLGHLDRLLINYYNSDVEKGIVTRDEVKKIFHSLLAYTEIRFEKYAGIHETSTTIIIGGCDEHGTTVFNDLTAIILEVAAEGRYIGTKINARVSASHNREYLMLLAKLLMSDVPVLAIQNDDVIIAAHEKYGYAVSDSRLYVSGGCNETVLANTEVNTRADSWINLPIILLDTMKSGSFADFNELYSKYISDVRSFHDELAAIKNASEKHWSERSPAPLYSSSVSDCIKNGRDITAGGARYNSTALSMLGIATIIDSLYAVKDVVYDKKLKTLDEFAAILDNNYENEEELRNYIINRVDKYCTDKIVGIDEFTAKFYRDIATVSGQKNARGGFYYPAIYPHDIFVGLGMKTGATPDGRRKGEILSRGISPSEFVTVNSPLDILNSLERYDFTDFNESLVLELTLPRLDKENGVDILVSLINAFIAKKGCTLQFNMLDRNVLIEAKENPERYRGLIIRVCGYSELFSNLSDIMKNEVINRAVRT